MWIQKADLPAINGFELKPQGACRLTICICISSLRRMLRGAQLNLTAFSQRIGQRVVADPGDAGLELRRIVPAAARCFSSIAPRPGLCRSGLQGAAGPPLAVPRQEGAGGHLGLLARVGFDLPGWAETSTYSARRCRNFEIIAAAQDTGGEAAAGKLDAAKATYTSLVDPGARGRGRRSSRPTCPPACGVRHMSAAGGGPGPSRPGPPAAPRRLAARPCYRRRAGRRRDSRLGGEWRQERLRVIAMRRLPNG